MLFRSNHIIEESLSKGATMAQVLEADRRLRQSHEGRTFRSFTAFLEDPQQQLRFRSAIGEVLSLPSGGAEGNPVNLEPRLARVSAGVHRLEDRLMVVLDVDRVLDVGRHAEAA